MQRFNALQYYKKYINVIVRIDKQGNQIPLAIVWDDGRTFKVDKILETKKAASQVGGAGILYRCLIQHQEKRLFLERERWFIESTQP